MIKTAVEAISKDAYRGTSTTISCKISGLDTKASVTWKKGDDAQDGVIEGKLADDKTQISTLTVENPQNDEVYTCVVTSGQYRSSPPTEKAVSINTFCKFGDFLLQLLILFHG